MKLLNQNMKKTIILILLLVMGCTHMIQADENLTNAISSELHDNGSVCFNDIAEDFDGVLIDNCYHLKTAIKENAIKGKNPSFSNDELIVILLKDGRIVKVAVISGEDKPYFIKYEYQQTQTVYEPDHVFCRNEY